MFQFQEGQSIDNRYTVVLPHKEGTYAETSHVTLLPQRLVLPSSGKAHCCWVDHGVLREQGLDVLDESIRRINGVEPVACQTKITDGIKNVFGFGIVVHLKPSLFQNVNLLLEREQLLGVFHNPINKKCPALVRYIPCGREAVAGSIVGKDKAFLRNNQKFNRKSA